MRKAKCEAISAQTPVPQTYYGTTTCMIPTAPVIPVQQSSIPVSSVSAVTTVQPQIIYQQSNSSVVMPPTISTTSIRRGIDWEQYRPRNPNETASYQPLFEYFALRPQYSQNLSTIKCGVLNATKLREAVAQNAIELSDFAARTLIRSIIEPGASSVFINFDQYCKIQKFILNATSIYNSLAEQAMPMFADKLVFAMNSLQIPISSSTATAFLNLPVINPEAKEIIENGGTAPSIISKTVFLNIVAATALCYKQFSKWSNGNCQLTIGFEEMMHMIAWFL